jgi:hypothetical protein
MEAAIGPRVLTTKQLLHDLPDSPTYSVLQRSQELDPWRM